MNHSFTVIIISLHIITLFKSPSVNVDSRKVNNNQKPAVNLCSGSHRTILDQLYPICSQRKKEFFPIWFDHFTVISFIYLFCFSKRDSLMSIIILLQNIIIQIRPHFHYCMCLLLTIDIRLISNNGWNRKSLWHSTQNPPIKSTLRKLCIMPYEKKFAVYGIILFVLEFFFLSLCQMRITIFA